MKIAVLNAPSNLGLRPPRPGHPPGAWRLPRALRAQGLLERLGAGDAGEVPPPAYTGEADPVTGFRNGQQIAAYTPMLAGRIARILRDQDFPIVLGGDCSILLGGTLALRTLGEFGLCFLDGHDDFSFPRSDHYHGIMTAAGLDLALATGHGPDELVNLHGLKPYVDPARVVALGFYKDPADDADFQTEAIFQTPIRTIDIQRVRAAGARQAAIEALAALATAAPRGFWIHLDADVLDQAVMPCVDSPNPNGLRVEELVEILGELLGSGRAVGLEITILDPELDPGGKYAGEFVSAIIQAFQQYRPASVNR